MAWSRRNLAPLLYIEVDGKPANDLLRYIKSFTFKQTVNKTTEVKFVMSEFSDGFIDDPRCGVNVVWRVRFGYMFDMSPIYPLVIRSLEPSYAMERSVTLVLHDLGSALGKDSAARNWGKVPSSDIARRLALDYGFIPDVEDSTDVPKKDWMQPGNVTNLEYLRQIAALSDWEVAFTGSPTRLVYRPKAYDSAPIGKLVYYENPSETSYVLSFEPKIKSLGPVKNKASGASTEKGKQGAAADAKNPDKLGSAANLTVRFSLVGDGRNTQTTVVPPRPASDKGVAAPTASGSSTKLVAGSIRAQLLDKANEASSKHPLTPSLRVGQLYEWVGLDQSFNRKWYLEEVVHTINGGTLSTTASWKRDAPGGKGKNNKDADKDAKAKEAKKADPLVRFSANAPATVVETK